MRALLMTPALLPYDAVSNDVRIQHQILQTQMPSYIYCDTYKEDGYSKNFLITKDRLKDFLKDPHTLLIYHHSIHWDLFELLFQSKAKIIFKYHNITPPSFFEPYSHLYAQACKMGREQTKEVSKLQALFVADSAYNALDLPDAYILPPFTILDDFHQPIDTSFASTLLQKRPNILFVGRFAPNKGHKSLLKTLFMLKKRGIDARLHIVGAIDTSLKSYYDEIVSLIKYYNLKNSVIIYDKVSFNKLLTLYKVSDLFLLLSEHEGFCVPVLEAQISHLPIVAVDRGAIVETMGFEDSIVSDFDYIELAKKVEALLMDVSLQNRLIQKGRKNIDRFEREKLQEQFLKIIHLLTL